MYVKILKGRGNVDVIRLTDVLNEDDKPKSKMGGAWFLQLAWMKNIIDGTYRGVTYFNFSALDKEKMGRFR